MKTRKLTKFSVLVLAFVLGTVVIFARADSALAEETNRNEVRKNLSSGGWYVVYGDLINEHDYLLFIEAVAESVATENPGPIYRFFSEQLQAQIDKISSEAPEIGREAAIDLLISAFDSNGRTLRHGRLEVSADVATYKRWEPVIYDEPRTYKCKQPLWPTGWTWITCTTMERVEKEIPLPNNFQPYFRFRWVSDEPGTTTGQSSFDEGWRICNVSSYQTVWVAYSYLSNNGTDWVRKGWRRIDRGNCSIILDKLNNRYVYYYAMSGTARWEGDVNLCIHPTKEFTRYSNQSCSSPYKLAHFVEVDTGTSPRWTTTLR